MTDTTALEALARQAGAGFYANTGTQPSCAVMTMQDLARFAALVRADERERVVQAVEAEAAMWRDEETIKTLRLAVAAIRALPALP